MSEQGVQQRQTARPDPAASRAAKSRPGAARLDRLAAALNGDSVRQRVPKKKLAQLAPKKKLAQLAPDKKLAQLAGEKKPAQLAPKKKKPAQLAIKRKRPVQRRPKPALQLAKNVPVNDDQTLEREADTMGRKALAVGIPAEGAGPHHASVRGDAVSGNIVQAVWVPSEEHLWHWDIPLQGVRWFTDGVYYWFDVENQQGEAYRAHAGIRNKRTHAQWKEMGAGDLPEADLHYEAMHALMPSGKKDEDVRWGPPTMSIGGQVHRLSKKNPFYQWLYENGPAPTEMNCYEVVLYAAVHAGIRSKDYVKQQIELDPMEKMAGGPKLAKHYHPVQLTNKNTKEELGKLPAVIPRGWVVVFGPNGEHVALSAGITNEKGHQVLELDQKGNVEMRSIEEITIKYKWIGYGPLP